MAHYTPLNLVVRRCVNSRLRRVLPTIMRADAPPKIGTGATEPPATRPDDQRRGSRRSPARRAALCGASGYRRSEVAAGLAVLTEHGAQFVLVERVAVVVVLDQFLQHVHDLDDPRDVVQHG